jgi:hypothetical protein
MDQPIPILIAPVGTLVLQPSRRRDGEIIHFIVSPTVLSSASFYFNRLLHGHMAEAMAFHSGENAPLHLQVHVASFIASKESLTRRYNICRM